ncbi:hypothetical protein J6590_023729 [Homalodisca vitripennis]|nr:hypothetical protein J6590_023729 [Homalodisca vitripennis]
MTAERAARQGGGGEVGGRACALPHLRLEVDAGVRQLGVVPWRRHCALYNVRTVLYSVHSCSRCALPPGYCYVIERRTSCESRHINMMPSQRQHVQ